MWLGCPLWRVSPPRVPRPATSRQSWASRSGRRRRRRSWRVCSATCSCCVSPGSRTRYRRTSGPRWNCWGTQASRWGHATGGRPAHAGAAKERRHQGEDMLQEDVRPTLELLRNAGIKVRTRYRRTSGPRWNCWGTQASRWVEDTLQEDVRPMLELQRNAGIKVRTRYRRTSDPRWNCWGTQASRWGHATGGRPAHAGTAEERRHHGEDTLQEDVRPTLKLQRNAGIKVRTRYRRTSGPRWNCRGTQASRWGHATGGRPAHAGTAEERRHQGEDTLQEDVRPMLELLRNAGIKVRTRYRRTSGPCWNCWGTQAWRWGRATGGRPAHAGTAEERRHLLPSPFLPLCLPPSLPLCLPASLVPFTHSPLPSLHICPCLPPDLDVDWRQAGDGDVYRQELQAGVALAGRPHVPLGDESRRRSPRAERIPAQTRLRPRHHWRVSAGEGGWGEGSWVRGRGGRWEGGHEVMVEMGRCSR